MHRARFGGMATCFADYLHGERSAATATVRRSRILEDKCLPHQRLFVIERYFVEINIALGIHEDARTILLEDVVPIPGLRVQPQCVGEPGTSAALHTHPQPAGCGNAFLCKELSDLLGRSLGDVNHLFYPASGAPLDNFSAASVRFA